MDIKILITIFVTIFLAELGDKTQIAIMLFAADNKEVSKLMVFVGASLALIVSSAIGVFAGSLVSQFISERDLHVIAGISFILIGIWTIIKV